MAESLIRDGICREVLDYVKNHGVPKKVRGQTLLDACLFFEGIELDVRMRGKGFEPLNSCEMGS